MKNEFNYGRVNAWGYGEHVTVRAEREKSFDGKRLIRIGVEKYGSDKEVVIIDDLHARMLAQLLLEYTT
jgi:hypothetical protein